MARGVAWAVPFFKGAQKVRLSNGEQVQSVLIGLDDATLIGGPAEFTEGSLANLRQPDSIIVDKAGAEGRLAKPSSTPGGKPIPLKVGDTLEINDKRAVVAGIARGLLASPVRVHTRGGDLDIAWAGSGQPVLMTGPAVTVFTGEIEL